MPKEISKSQYQKASKVVSAYAKQESRKAYKKGKKATKKYAKNASKTIKGWFQ